MVEIIVPFYNAEATLAQTLSSVEAQTCTDWRVIFIDDGSSDSSAVIAETFIQKNNGKGKIIQSQKARSGPAVGRNLALQNAEGVYFVCLDSDDLLAPFCLAQRVGVMQKNADLDWAVFNQYQSRPGEKESNQIFNLPAKTRDEAIAYFLKMQTAWQTMAPIWKTEALRKLGGFDETLFPSEDPDIHLRALLDTNLQMKICSDLPADCYYFTGNKSEDKIAAFWRDSITSKFRFLKKTVQYVPNIVSTQTLKTYRKYLRKGYFNFIKGFLLSRLTDYTKELQEMNLLLKQKNVLSATDLIKIKAITMLYTTSSPVVSQLKIRGLVHRLFLEV